MKTLYYQHYRSIRRIYKKGDAFLFYFSFPYTHIKFVLYLNRFHNDVFWSNFSFFFIYSRWMRGSSLFFSPFSYLIQALSATPSISTLIPQKKHKKKHSKSIKIWKKCRFPPPFHILFIFFSLFYFNYWRLIQI